MHMLKWEIFSVLPENMSSRLPSRHVFRWKKNLTLGITSVLLKKNLPDLKIQSMNMPILLISRI